MARCPFCGSCLLQREMDGDITCLVCTRTVTQRIAALPLAGSKAFTHRTGPKPSDPDRRVCGGCRRSLPLSDYGQHHRSGTLLTTCLSCARARAARKQAGAQLARRSA